jgi:uncharacterized protein YtpQ (UPF0354 family)
MRIALRVVFAVLLLLSAARQSPAALPTDETGFTKAMAEQFAKALPGVTVTVAGPLALKIELEPGKPNDLRLINAWDFCQRDRAHCEQIAAAFVTNMSGTLKEETAPIRKADIRATVRQQSYVEDMQHTAASKAGAAPVVEKIAGDLWMVCVVDMPHGVRMLNHNDLTKLGLSEDDAIALAKSNLAANLPPLAKVLKELKPGEANEIAGDFYDPSRILAHDDWAPLAEALHHHLVVAVPATELLIYGDGRNKQAIGDIETYVSAIAAKAPRAVSTTLLHWTPTGWREVKGTEPDQ